ncbi:MAG: hypothetical protein LE169_01690 [Endomicrobium sp.]|nr:hypothetical protein [Endomicrobium sp.]
MISTLEQTAQNQENEIKELRATIAQKKDAITMSETTVANLQRAVDEYNIKLKDATVSSNYWQEEAKKLPALREEIARLKNQLAIESQNWRNLADSCKVKETTINSLQKQLSELQTQRQQYIDREGLTNQSLLNLKAQIRKLTTEVQEYKDRVILQESTINAQCLEIGRLKK